MSLLNVAPSLPMKLGDVSLRSDPPRLQLMAKPAGLLGWIVQLLGGGEDARIVADAHTCTVEQRTFTGRRRVVLQTSNLEGAVLARSTRLAKTVAALSFALPFIIFLFVGLAGGEPGALLFALLFLILIVAALLRPLKSEIGVLAGGVFHGLGVQFKSAELDQLQKATTCLEGLITGQVPASRPFDFGDDDGGFGGPAAVGSDDSEFDWGEEPDDEPIAPPAPSASGTFTRECPSCGQKLRSKKPLDGKRLTCPGCKASVQL